MSTTAADWISIAKQVAANPFVKISCPDCGEGYLQILIVPWENEEPKVDVHLMCGHCGVRNTITKEAEVVGSVSNGNAFG